MRCRSVVVRMLQRCIARSMPSSTRAHRRRSTRRVRHTPSIVAVVAKSVPRSHTSTGKFMRRIIVRRRAPLSTRPRSSTGAAAGEIPADVSGGRAVHRLHRRHERQASASALAARSRPRVNMIANGRYCAPATARERSARARGRLGDHDLLDAGDVGGERRRHHRHRAAHLLEPRRRTAAACARYASSTRGRRTRCDSTSRFITDDRARASARRRRSPPSSAAGRSGRVRSC